LRTLIVVMFWWAQNRPGEFAIGGLKGQNRVAQRQGRDSGRSPGEVFNSRPIALKGRDRCGVNLMAVAPFQGGQRSLFR
jgi:hypothetical protein